MNKLYFGDNLDILRDKIPDNFIDLIYLDPPFQSGRTYNIIFQPEAGEIKGANAEIKTFKDSWKWGIEAEKNYGGLINGTINKEKPGQKLEDLISLDAIPQFSTPSLLDTIRNIDVIWFEDEFPVCCFEVEHTTGVTTDLLRLYQTSQLNTKLFVIAPADVLKKFETEMNKMPFRKMKNRYIFRSYQDLINFYYLAENYTKSKSDFFKE